jgi:hypothetical protein
MARVTLQKKKKKKTSSHADKTISKNRKTIIQTNKASKNIYIKTEKIYRLIKKKKKKANRPLVPGTAGARTD